MQDTDSTNTPTTLSPSGDRQPADPARTGDKPARRLATLQATPASITSETRELLRDRLRIVSAIVAAELAMFAVRDLLAAQGSFLPWVRASLVFMYAALAIWLRGARSLTLDQLRRLEFIMVWVVSAWFAIDRFHYIRDRSAANDEAATVFAVDFAVLEYVVVMTAYAIFIPNTWQRALRMTTPLALLPALIVGLVGAMYPGDAATLGTVLTPTRVSTLALMLLIGLLFSAGGARLIHALREQVFEARQLGQYRLIDRIGIGGMGEVWRGEHQLLPRPAAIKLIRPDRLHTSSPLEVEATLGRFEREVRATSTLRSPHTVEIYDFGITDDQVFYYVMELLDGLDLRNLVKRFGPLPESRVAHLLGQVCESLPEAHGQGLVHRDIKPANIYVCRLGNRFDYVKVLDFGLVDAIDPGNESTGLVADAGVAGTPAFMAPEMLQGEQLIDGRADIYALGCVGYWLLTGELVFAGDNVVDIARGHLTGPVVPPSAQCGRRLDTGVEDAVLACLAKDPAHRPASAEALSDQLTTASATEAWMNHQARDWWQSTLAP